MVEWFSVLTLEGSCLEMNPGPTTDLFCALG